MQPQPPGHLQPSGQGPQGRGEGEGGLRLGGASGGSGPDWCGFTVEADVPAAWAGMFRQWRPYEGAVEAAAAAAGTDGALGSLWPVLRCPVGP